MKHDKMPYNDGSTTRRDVASRRHEWLANIVVSRHGRRRLRRIVGFAAAIRLITKSTDEPFHQ
jgi:hypothetical protein